jgi:hypothetical protein
MNKQEMPLMLSERMYNNEPVPPTKLGIGSHLYYVQG